MSPAFIIAAAVACALIGIPLGIWKDRWWFGLLAGLFLGPFGLLVMLVIPVSRSARIRREQARISIRREAAERAAGRS